MKRHSFAVHLSGLSGFVRLTLTCVVALSLVGNVAAPARAGHPDSSFEKLARDPSHSTNASLSIPQIAKLVASDGTAQDRFGISVAVSGDVAVVGAHRADASGDIDRGAAYVFGRDQGGADQWGLVKQLVADDGMPGDFMGRSVAVSEDTIVVGAYLDDVTNLDQGSAYVFARDQGGPNNWGQVKHLTVTESITNEWFGYAVAVSGDIIVVGVYQDDVGANQDQGSAYVFARDQGGANNWGLVKQLVADDGEELDQFGYSVAASQDMIAIGAPHDNVGTIMNQGSVYVFARNQGGADNWGQVKQLVAGDGAEGDYFGFSVAMSGDVVAAGAYYDDGDGTVDQGSAYVFERDQGGANQWGQAAKLTANDGDAWDEFGYSVGATENTVIVGSLCDNVGTNSDQGSAYVYGRDQGGANQWGQITRIVASDGEARDAFGSSVAASGEILMAGAPNETTTKQGAAYIYRMIESTLALDKQVQPTSEVPYHSAVTYQLVLSNTGTENASAVLLTDTLPIQVNFGDWIEQPAGASVLGRQVTWSGVVAASDAITLAFTAVHVGDYAETVTNTAQFQGAQQSGISSAVFTVTSHVTGPALALDKQVQPTTNVPYHSTVTYTLVLSNTGTEGDDAVFLTDTLPIQVNFGNWIEQPAGASVLGRRITWSGAVAVSDAITLAFTAIHVGDYAETVTNTALFKGTQQTGNSSAIFTVAKEACQPVSGVDLTVATAGNIYAGNPTQFQANLTPNGATPPYTYTVYLGGQTLLVPQTSSHDPIQFSHTFANTGTFTVEIQVWNCDVTQPVSDTVNIVVEQALHIYLPIILKNETS